MPGLSAVFLQRLGGLSYATTLFLMASGLMLIFGVTRIVNFAHGSFFMLGALFTAHWVTNWFPACGDIAALYLLAIISGAVIAGLAGGIAKFFLLRCMSGAPELYQLVATFGLTLAMHDAMQWGFGPDEVFAPRFPGLKGSVAIGDEFFPVYQLVMIALGPLVWWGAAWAAAPFAVRPAPARCHAGPVNAGCARRQPQALDAGRCGAGMRAGRAGQGACSCRVNQRICKWT